MNLISPEVASFLLGDLVGVTMVIPNRPQAQSTPTPGPEFSVVVDA